MAAVLGHAIVVELSDACACGGDHAFAGCECIGDRLIQSLQLCIDFRVVMRAFAVRCNMCVVMCKYSSIARRLATRFGSRK